MHETRALSTQVSRSPRSLSRSARLRLALALAVCSSVRLFLRSFVRSGNVRLSTAFAEPDSTNSSVCFVLPCYYSRDPRRVGQRGAPPQVPANRGEMQPGLLLPSKAGDFKTAFLKLFYCTHRATLHSFNDAIAFDKNSAPFRPKCPVERHYMVKVANC